MFDFLFFIKTLLVTLLLVSMMQIKVGDQTIETRATMWIRSPAVTGTFGKTAQGGAKAVRDAGGWLKSQLHAQMGKWFGKDSGSGKDSAAGSESAAGSASESEWGSDTGSNAKSNSKSKSGFRWVSEMSEQRRREKQESATKKVAEEIKSEQ
jgi:hypothetical protein